MNKHLIEFDRDCAISLITITAGFWMIILVEVFFGLGPMYPEWIPRWVLVGFISVCVGSVWVLLYKINLIPKDEM